MLKYLFYIQKICISCKIVSCEDNLQLKPHAWFSGETEKKITNLLSADFAQRVLKVKSATIKPICIISMRGT